MAKCGIITLTQAPINVGNFSLYSDVDSYNVPFETGVSRANLLAGYYTILIPDLTSIIRVQSNDVCTNYIDLTIPPPILTSFGAITVITSITDEYEVSRVVNHTNHTSPNVITMTFNYDLSAYAFASYAASEIHYRKNGGGWQFVDGVYASSTISTSTISGSFNITSVDYNDLVEVKAHFYAYIPGFDAGYVSFYSTGGSVTSGYGTVESTSPSSWGVYFPL